MNLLSLARLPIADQAAIERLACAFTAITPPLEPAWRRIAADCGFSWQQIRGKYYAWKRRGLHGLVNAARHPDFSAARETGSVSDDTYEYYRRLCIENGRKCRTAFKKLCREFFAGADIPGIAPGTDRHRLPRGFTYSNFQRHAPTPFEIRSARQGLRSAAEFRPLVYTSRKQMHLLEELQFDDVWHDFETVLLGRSQRVRPLQLGALDVFSSCLVKWCVKARIRRDDDTRTNLGPNDLIFLLAALFGELGHHPAGTRLNFEAGTARPPDEAVDLIHRLSGGAVKCRIGKTAAPRAFGAQYPGPAKGNFHLRPHIESFWNLTHNETADRTSFPGQTGSNARVNGPEDLIGRAKEMDLILRALPALPAQVVETLRKPLPEFMEAVRAIGEINERMNRRTDHKCEGFQDAGLVTTDFDVPNLGIIPRAEFEARLTGHSAEEKSLLLALCRPISRLMSPREVVESRRHELVRWQPDSIARLLYPARREGVVRVQKDHLVEFTDQEISPEPLRFLAHHFSPGTEFESVCNPMVPDLLFIYDATHARRGAWLGVLEHWGRVSRADHEATARQMYRAEKIKNDLRRPLIALGDRLTAQRQADVDHNNRVMTTQTNQQQTDDDATDRALSASLK